MTISTDTWIRQKRVERAENLAKAANDLKFRQALIEKAHRDPVFYFNQFCWTYDPRPGAKPNHFPFLTYPFQDEHILNLEASYLGGYDLLTDKSRDMGVTWLELGWIGWHWWKDAAFNALLGSRKEDLVDKIGEPDTLFEKLAYILRRLPPWLLPKGFDLDKHRNFCHILNPETGNTIKGESANADFSRQGRYSVIFMDEFASWQHADAAWTATGDATTVRHAVSTPKGKGNKFADLRFSNQIKVISLHWPLHPKKDQVWYENEKARRTPREVAQELDIDYEASGTERVFSLKFNKVLRDHVVIDPFLVPEHWKFRGGLDYGTRNKASFHAYAQDYDSTHFSAWEWRRNMEDLAKEGFKGSMVQAIALMLFACPYGHLLDHIRADPSLWVENQNSPDGMTSIIRQLYDEIAKINKERVKQGLPERKFAFLEGAQNDLACIEATNTFWADPERPQFKMFKTCKEQIEEIEELMWEEWSEAQAEKRNVREKIMDKNNHSWDDYKYYIMSRHAAPKQEPKKAGRGTMGHFLDRWEKDQGHNSRLRT